MVVIGGGHRLTTVAAIRRRPRRTAMVRPPDPTRERPPHRLDKRTAYEHTRVGVRCALGHRAWHQQVKPTGARVMAPVKSESTKLATPLCGSRRAIILMAGDSSIPVAAPDIPL